MSKNEMTKKEMEQQSKSMFDQFEKIIDGKPDGAIIVAIAALLIDICSDMPIGEAKELLEPMNKVVIHCLETGTGFEWLN